VGVFGDGCFLAEGLSCEGGRAAWSTVVSRHAAAACPRRTGTLLSLSACVGWTLASVQKGERKKERHTKIIRGEMGMRT